MKPHKSHEASEGRQWPMEAAVGSADPQDGLWHAIRRRRRIVLSLVSICLALATIYLKQAVPMYTSTSRLYVEQTGPKIISDSEGVMTQSKNYLHTQVELLKSDPILVAALNKPGIRELAVFNGVDDLG